jgi:MFS family permease
MKPSPAALRQILHPAVIVGALGYFVDVYDLILFSIVRGASLKGLGVPADQILSKGVLLLNWQMGGMLIGGIFFGMLGDRFGRVALLFGSILLYSIANIVNGFVQTIEAYALWRFIAGFGLAGELGGGITLVTEVLPKELRGYGTAIVSSVGVFGAVIGGLVAQKVAWQHAYFIGGGLSSGTFYLVTLLMGFGVGYWTIFVTVAAEQFGTNIRATVATTVPNFVRGATVPLTLAFNGLKPHTGVIGSAAIVSAASILIALWAVWGMQETHGKDLDYIETM